MTDHVSPEFHEQQNMMRLISLLNTGSLQQEETQAYMWMLRGNTKFSSARLYKHTCLYKHKDQGCGIK